jgi:putative FmdB family regulatory protein
MPTYEYKCQDCGKESEVSLSMTEHDRGQITCPECKSSRMEQLMSAVSAKTSRKS